MSKTKLGHQIAVQVTAAATGGAVLVHSVPSRKELSTVKASNLSEGKSMYSCSSCSTNVVASSHAAPSCISCGSSTVKTQASVKPEMGPVVAVECRHCAAVHLMEANVVRASGYHLHCSVCGESNDYKKQSAKIEAALSEEDLLAAADRTADENLELDVSDLDAELSKEPTAEAVPEAAEPVAAAGDGWPFDEGAEEVNASEWPLDGEDPVADELASGDDISLEDVGEEVAAGAEDEDDLALELEDLDGPVAANADEMPMEEVPEEASSDEAPEYCAPDLDTGETLADAMELDDTDAGLTMQATAGRVVAMKGHVAVASLKPADAGANSSIITTPSFQSAVLHLAKKDGMRKALAAVGFKPIRIQTLTAATVARKVQEAQQTTVNSSAEKTASFTESIALAAAGLSRGAWKGKSNPLQAALLSELRAIGVKNPERIIARVMAANLVPTAKVLVELAADLNSMSSNARKETANILGMTEVVSGPQEEDEEDEDATSDVKASTGDFQSRLRSTAAVLPSVLSPSLNLGPRDAKRQAVSASATARALNILDGNAPLMLG
jgi:hypothetical protein